MSLESTMTRPSARTRVSEAHRTRRSPAQVDRRVSVLVFVQAYGQGGHTNRSHSGPIPREINADRWCISTGFIPIWMDRKWMDRRYRFASLAPGPSHCRTPRPLDGPRVHFEERADHCDVSIWTIVAQNSLLHVRQRGCARLSAHDRRLGQREIQRHQF